jgi:hypothetical protein
MKFLIPIFLILLISILEISCRSRDPLLYGTHYDSSPISHDIFNNLLAKHVSDSGNVNYKGFIADSVRFNKYFELLENNHPNRKWSKNERLAFWINTYNAYTIRLVITNYPVKSIKDIGGSIYKVNTAWDIKLIKIGDEIYDLNNIEHQKIRGQFDEPRIHFAINCASVSCPKLLNEAFYPERLEEQLEQVTSEFVNDKKKNLITSEKATLSKIFSWYRGDFKLENESVTDFINKYSEVKLNSNIDVDYMDYDWNLNDVQTEINSPISE